MSSKVIVADEKCYRISVDVSKNRMYLVIIEKWIKEVDLEDFQKNWIKGVEQLIPDFTIHSDVRKMAVVSNELAQVFANMQLYSVEKGLLHAAEIAAINDIANLQVQQMSKRSDLPFSRFKTPEQAENFLDKLQSTQEQNTQ